MIDWNLITYKVLDQGCTINSNAVLPLFKDHSQHGLHFGVGFHLGLSTISTAAKVHMPHLCKMLDCCHGVKGWLMALSTMGCFKNALLLKCELCWSSLDMQMAAGVVLNVIVRCCV